MLLCNRETSARITSLRDPFKSLPEVTVRTSANRILLSERRAYSDATCDHEVPVENSISGYKTTSAGTLPFPSAKAGKGPWDNVMVSIALSVDEDTVAFGNKCTSYLSGSDTSWLRMNLVLFT